MKPNFYTRVTLMLLCLCLGSVTSFAQVQILTPNDTIVCNGGSATLRAEMHGRSKHVISLAVDDDYSSVIPIGFSFDFYGSTYSQCVVSSNGFISFNTSNAGNYSNWDVNQPLLGNPNCLNAICGAYSDIYPLGGGNIDYATVGTAPNREFVVTFCNCAMYSPSLGCNDLISFQMILYETTNVIEVHIKNKTVCQFWPSSGTPGTAIEGLQNAGGTLAVAVPGRDYPSQWTAYDDGQRFTPDSGFTNYTVDPIPFNPVPDSQATLYWYQGSTQIGTGPTVTVTPTGPTVYTVMATDCGDTTYASVEVLIGGGPTISYISTVNPTTCGACDGKITLHGLPPNQIDTVAYQYNGVQQPIHIMSSGSDSTITFTNLCDGVYNNFTVKAGVCTSAPAGPVSLSAPSIAADFNYTVHNGCTSDTVLFNNLSTTPGGTMHVKWNFGDGSSLDTTLNPVHVYQNQGSYTVRLYITNTYCTDSTIQIIDINHPIHASFTVSPDTICQHQTINFTNTSVGTNPSYVWDFGDGATSNSLNPSHTYDVSGAYTVTLTEQDFVPCFDTATYMVQVDSISFIDFNASSFSICQGQAVTFTGSYISEGYTGNLWLFGDNVAIKDQNPIQHAYDAPGTYTIKLWANYRVCPDTSISKSITVLPFPNVNLGPDTSMCPGAPPIPITDMANVGNPGATWQWNTGDSTASILATQPGIYYTTVTVNGCSNSDSIWVQNDCYMNIPNAFTPNDDGVNDYFFPRQFLTRSVVSFKMAVYDRWGEEIFETTNLDGRGWDGKFNGQPQPTGVYIYIIDATFANGHVEHHQGNVTLIR